MSAAGAPPVVIVGAGLAAWTTARELRKLDAAVSIALVTRDNGDFYAKPTLSNAFGQKRSPDQLVTTAAASMAQNLGVTLHTHTTVQSIDTAANTLSVAQGGKSEVLAYGQLVLATGANPIRIPMQGDAAQAVQSVNHLDDFRRFHAELSALPARADGQPHCVLVIGAGLIGCEFANDLVQAGYAVHVVDPAPGPLTALLPAAAAEQLRQALQALGVVWHWGTTVQTLQAAAAGAHRYVGTLSDGTSVAADAVLSAVGLRADTALAAQAGLACARGVLVDAHLQTSATGVFALGDCAQYASAGGRTLPYVMPIMNAARALAATLAGTPTELVFPLMPVAVKTPALPITVAAPHPDLQGTWTLDPATEGLAEGGAWRFVDADGAQRGFVLTGKQCSKRMEWTKATVL
jgi:rubredoxin-NAD+ reductase